MRNLPNGFLAAHLADMIEANKCNRGTSAVARALRVGEFRAAEIRDRAIEKISQRKLEFFPKPNHENQLKEYMR